MFLRRTQRKKDGKTHSYWNIVESKRLDDGRVVQRQVLYLGEINSSQAEAWRKAIEVFDEDAGRPRTLALFAAEPVEAVPADDRVVRVHLSELRLYRPRQWGACWLAGHLWRELELDRFWKERLAPSRKGTRWDQILQVLVSYRLIAPGSEWKLHRDWFGKSAMADVLGGDFGLAEAHKLYACHDRLLEHKDALFAHLVERWRTLFSVEFDVLLYDLTSTYFEVDAADLPDGDKRRHGYSRDKRPDCPQVVIALVVTPEGLPLAYEVLPGNTADNKTLRAFLSKIESQYGKARRVWVMDRGIPTEEVLAEMRRSDPPVQYLVGTPKGRLTRLEKHLADKPWQEVRDGIQVKLLAEDNELYIFAQSADRITKERAMRRRHLKWLWKRLGQLAAMEISREEMLMKLGAARAKAPAAWRLVEIEMDKESSMFLYTLNRQKLRTVRRREGRYLLRTNLTESDPALAVAILCPACCRGRSLQEPERRLGDPADLSSGGASDRSAHLHRVPGLLLVHHPTSSPLCLGAGAHGAKRPGKVRGCSDDRRPCADYGWPRTRTDPLHPARAGIATPDPAAQAPFAAPAASANRRSRARLTPRCSEDLFR